MKIEQVHTLILGAGPAGLAAGYTLAKAGHSPVVLERNKVSGGLMRSIKRGEFTVDVGRKELYNRLKEVDSFWGEILGDDYKGYPHRGGILYDGHIIDISSFFRGFRRGMPWSMFFGCGWDFLSSRVGWGRSSPRNLEEYFYQKRGRRLTQIVSQGFQEKLNCEKWAEIPLPENYVDTLDASFVRTAKGLLTRAFSKAEANTFQGAWKHPTGGTGQICAAMEKGIRDNSGRVEFEANVSAITSENGVISAVEAEVGGEAVTYEPAHVVSSIPVSILLKLLMPGGRADDAGGAQGSPSAPRRTIVLVYLFLDESPRFPHAWLNVTCPKTRIGRITNYAAIHDEMVPKGKTSLCCEFYCNEGERLLERTNDELVELALAECSKSTLIEDSAHCFDNLVLRLPGADASQNRHNWMARMKASFLDDLKQFQNLYFVSRTDLDIATLAGLESGEAILTGDRTKFDRHIDPSELPIRSVKKTFEFKNPADQ